MQTHFFAESVFELVHPVCLLRAPSYKFCLVDDCATRRLFMARARRKYVILTSRTVHAVSDAATIKQAEPVCRRDASSRPLPEALGVSLEAERLKLLSVSHGDRSFRGRCFTRGYVPTVRASRWVLLQGWGGPCGCNLSAKSVSVVMGRWGDSPPHCFRGSEVRS